MIADQSIKTSKQIQAAGANADTPQAPPNSSVDVRQGTIPPILTPDTSNWPLQSVSIDDCCIVPDKLIDQITGRIKSGTRIIYGGDRRNKLLSRYPKDALLKVMDR